MSDPAVYNDHREAAEVGRRLKELEGAVQARAGVARRRRPTSRRRATTPSCASSSPSSSSASPRSRRSCRLALVERDPADAQGRDPRGPAGRRRRRGGALGRRRLPDAVPLRRAARLQVEELGASPNEGGGFKEVVVRDQGRRRLLGLQVGGRHAPRAARPGDRDAGPHPHLDRDGRGDARGRGGRGRDRPERPEDRRLPLDRARAARASTRPTPRCGSRTCRPASSSRCRTRSRSSRTSEKAMRVLRARLYERRARAAAGGAAAKRRSQIGSGERAEKIRTYNFAENRVTDHRIKLTVHQLDRILAGRARRVHRGADRRGPPARARAT